MIAARRHLTVLLALVVASCALFPQPRNLEEAVFSAAATIRALRESTADRLEAGIINQAEADLISAELDQARTYVDIATSALEMNAPTDAQAALDLAIAILDRVTPHAKPGTD